MISTGADCFWAFSRQLSRLWSHTGLFSAYFLVFGIMLGFFPSIVASLVLYWAFSGLLSRLWSYTGLFPVYGLVFGRILGFPFRVFILILYYRFIIV